MRESAENEERNAEKKRKHIAFTGEGHSCSHNETATYCKNSGSERTVIHSALNDALSSTLKVVGRHSGHKADNQAAYNVSKKNEKKSRNFVLLDKTGSTGEKTELICNDCEESESEYDCTWNATDTQLAESGQTNCKSGQHSRTE